jgi:hypothetical protein
MTIGKLASEEDFKVAINEVIDINDIFNIIVNRISIEMIDENEDSLIEMEIELL